MSSHAERIGQELGDYRLLRWMGSGGFGDVYLGEHRYEHSLVAVKVLHARLTRGEDLKEFINEARTIRLSHPHIVPLLDFGVGSDETPYLVMAYAPHGTLRDRHPKGSQLSRSTIVSYVIPIASALQYAHMRHLIHRDVKPENMLVGGKGEILLSDFGIATVPHSSRSFSTQQGIGGTLPYMAPEQIQGKPRASSDQYALGIVVYEWLSGKRPFSGTAVELAMQHVMTPPPPFHEQVPTLPKDVEQVVLRALAKDPRQRFATVEEFAHALERAGQQTEMPRSSTEHIPSVVSPLPPPTPAPVYPPIDQVTRVDPKVIETPPSAMPAISPSGVQEGSMNTPSDAGVLPSSFVAPTASTRFMPQPLPSPVPYPPSHGGPQQLRRRGLSRRAILLLCVLLLLILGSGGGWYATMKLSTDHAQATATAYVQATAQAQTMATAHVQVTAQAQATARAAATGYASFVATNGIMFGFDAQHSRANPYEQILNPTTVVHLTKKWAFPIGSYIYSSPAVVNGVVYVGSNDGNLYALDAASGSKKWIYHTGASISSSPAVINGMVYVGSDNGNLYALDAASGSKKWFYQTGNDIFSSPAVVNGMVYVGSWDGNLYALDAASGVKKWAFQTATGISSSPAVVNGVVYVGSDNGNLYAFDAASGRPKWVFHTEASISSSPAVANGVVYVGSADHNLYALDAASATKKWTFPTGNYIESSPAVANGVVYVGSDDGSLYALDAASGTKKWFFPTGDNIYYSSPTVANGVVYIGSADHNLYALDTASGTKKWTFATGNNISSSPAVVNGVVYVGSWDGNLYAFGLSQT